ncbi:SRPBCC family protein [Streptomyces sulphureus]|uniref:SRPBCC family protein n=1 Tax=Streptomyces sulphureus TaxID=47758 RepID=UPI0003608DA4|nr:SRPBCC family protein [Streptomyces sulphureus]
MKIDNEFTVRAPVEGAWAALTDLEGLAPCLPGAQLTGVEHGPDGDVYNGKVKVKVGPVVSQFAGTARFAERDAAERHAVVGAKGKDARGGGNASATIDMRLRPDGDDRTVVSVHTDLSITGKLAQFGSGMIKEISEKLLAQFVSNLEERLLAPEEPAPGEETVGAQPAESQESSGSSAGAERAREVVSAPARESGARLAGAEPEATPAALGTTPERTSAPVEEPATAGEAEPVSAPPSASAGAVPTREAGSQVRGTSPAGSPSGTGAKAADEGEAEALDLMGLAGASVYKRVVPAGVVVLVLIVVLVLVFVL